MKIPFKKKLLNWRKNASVIHTGKLIHFIPKDGVYVYFRYDKDKKVMVILNKNESTYELDLHRFEEMLTDVKKGKDVLSGKSISLDVKIILEHKGAIILELE